MSRLLNKVAIVTGGARGIGKATAELFAQNGAKIIIWDMLDAGEETVAEFKAKGYTAEFMKLSVTDYPALENATRDIAERYGSIDILINNAGITRDKSFAKMSHFEWQSVIDVNLTGVFNCTKAVIPYMLEKKYGRIVCAASVVGLTGNFGQTNYVATKAGIIGMVKTWAKELAKNNITANAVAPGFIKTDMTDLMPEEARAKMVENIPARRMGEVSDIANAYLYLASDEAAYVNGHCLSVNGGLA